MYSVFCEWLEYMQPVLFYYLNQLILTQPSTDKSYDSSTTRSWKSEIESEFEEPWFRQLKDTYYLYAYMHVLTHVLQMFWALVEASFLLMDVI